jgi:hypothetical protein
MFADAVMLIFLVQGRSILVHCPGRWKTFVNLPVRIKYFPVKPNVESRSQWTRDLRHELSSLVRTLRLWVRIPFKARMYVCIYSVFISSDLATGWSPFRGVLTTVLGLRNWSETKRYTDALCSKVRGKGKRRNIALNVLYHDATTSVTLFSLPFF